MISTFPEISISTERLVLRPFDEEDVPELVEMMNDELVRAWSSAPAPYTQEDARTWVRTTAPAERSEGRGLVFAVAEVLTARLVGIVHLSHTDWRSRTTEISYLTAAWARGEGYAPESVLATAQWLFQDRSFDRLELRTPAGNTASQQVAQKAGFISEGVLRSAGLVRNQETDGPGAWSRTDIIVWSLLPEDLDGGTHLGVATVGGRRPDLD
jgi:RimJ/RimL family protein N-acetyltransferase